MVTSCKTILIVEDDNDIRDALREVLEADGYSVLTAANGQAALDVLNATEKPALIFLDIMMPIMDGHEFLRLVRKNVALAPIPVVVTSATVEQHHVKHATSFIRKPFDLNTVLKVAEKYCHS